MFNTFVLKTADSTYVTDLAGGVEKSDILQRKDIKLKEEKDNDVKIKTRKAGKKYIYAAADLNNSCPFV